MLFLVPGCAKLAHLEIFEEIVGERDRVADSVKTSYRGVYIITKNILEMRRCLPIKETKSFIVKSFNDYFGTRLYELSVSRNLSRKDGNPSIWRPRELTD